MINQLTIENYKSIAHLTLDVGRVNVFIGENGCGKTNILEALTFAAAAEANKLDNEFLRNRGIRVTEPQLMRSAFEEKNCWDIIKMQLNAGMIQHYILKNDNEPYSKWICDDKIKVIVNCNTFYKFIKKIESKGIDLKCFDKIPIEVEFNTEFYKLNYEEDTIETAFHIFDNFKIEFNNFLIYSPENSTLRNFDKEASIEPLGIYGEGLLKLLMVIQHEATTSESVQEQLNDIIETLSLFDWFDTLQLPNDLPLLERKLIIKDKYLTRLFDQRNANEGFLLILFYITLMVSHYTPKIFAIDNIDTALNPKLCTQLIKELTRLAKKYDKQCFVTSHNPAILDGVDLNDNEQCLFVVARNEQGHTYCNRLTLENKPKSSARSRIARLIKENETLTREELLNRFDNSDEPLKLSEAFLRGYLGGLPKGF